MTISFYIGVESTIKNIQIDGVNETENGVITIKLFNQYFDYKYNYNEVKQYRIHSIESNKEELDNATIIYQNIASGETQKYYYEK